MMPCSLPLNRGDQLDESAHGLVGRNALSLSLKTQHDAMPQRVVRNGLYIVGADKVLSREVRMTPGGEIKRNRASGGCAKTDPSSQGFV
jgi:hypothetical protein